MPNYLTVNNRTDMRDVNQQFRERKNFQFQIFSLSEWIETCNCNAARVYDALSRKITRGERKEHIFTRLNFVKRHSWTSKCFVYIKKNSITCSIAWLDVKNVHYMGEKNLEQNNWQLTAHAAGSFSLLTRKY